MSTVQTLYCALIPVAGTPGNASLLLPNTAIAETLTKESLAPISGAPPGVAGVVRYSERTLPVLSLDALGGQPATLQARSRVVVLHALGEAGGDHPAFALLASGYPHLVAVTERLLSELPLSDEDQAMAAAARVRVGNTEALIPDVDRLEALAQAFHRAHNPQ